MEVVAPIGFAISVVQARTILTSIKKRIENYRKGPRTFQSLTNDVDRLDRQIARMEQLLEKFPSALPSDISASFYEEFASVGENLEDALSTMERSLNAAFAGRSSMMGNLSSKRRRMLQATELTAEMDKMKLKIDKASNQLQHLISVLANAIKTDESTAAVTSKIDEHRDVAISRVDENKSVITSKIDERCDALESKIDSIHVDVTLQEAYTPGVNTPAPSHTMILDFNARDEKGSSATPEGVLKQSVLYGESSQAVTAVTGSVCPAYGVLGMAGVGKTVALRGLGHDEEVKKRFSGGVHYMTFGRDATLQSVIGEIASIMTLSGASTQVQNVKSATSLRDAVNYALTWFQGKTCLYLVDDLWPSENLPKNYFDDLRQLLRGSPLSRMAISTRSVDIASEAGSVVDFGPRDPLGKVSVNMFMSHATGHPTPQSSSAAIHNLRPSVTKILSICGGLPIALAVTGRAIFKYVRVYGTFEKSCDAYSAKLEMKRTLVGGKCTGYGMSLQVAIELSLEHLKFEFSELVRENSIQVDSSILDLYTSLCVLPNQGWVPASVLSRLWKLEENVAFDVASLFVGMSLATLSVRRISSELPDEAGIVLHDLQLDFCRRQAMETKKFPFWHAQLLDEYLESSPLPEAEKANANLLTIIMDCTPRPWWSDTVPEDGYIHANLSRHLSCAGREIELAAMVLDARWTELRGRVGGILAFKTDFELLRSFFVQSTSSRNHEAMLDVERSFEQIFKTVQLSWGWLVTGWRAFQFQVCGRLVQLKQWDEVVATYLRSVETNTPKPCLVPVSPFFPDIDGAQILEIPVGGNCRSVACSPCGRYIAAGAGADVVVADSSTGEILKRMQGHTGSVYCITFIVGSEKIVSGSYNRKVIVWTWESSDTPTQVFEGHGSWINGVAVSADGQRITSTSEDRTVRAWGTTAGTKTWELVERSAVRSVAVCAKDEKIALGLEDGTLKVLDGITKETLFEDTKAHDECVDCVSFCPSGSYLATGSWDRTVLLWNTQTWTSKRFEGHDRLVTGVAFNRDGNQIASSSDDGTIRLWDVDSGKCVGVSPKIGSRMRGVTFTADGERIVSGSSDGVIRIWDARLGSESKEQRYEHNGAVLGVAISADGLRVASASKNGTVHLWDSVTGDHVGVPLQDHGGPVRCVSFSPDGRRVVSGSDDMTLRLWDAETCTQVGTPFEGHTGSVWGVSFSSDGRRIISRSWQCVRIWNAETHEQVGDALQGHKGTIDCVSESAGGFHIVSRGCSGNTTIWNRDSRAMIWTSENVENEICDSEAEKIIRSCGPQTPHLWPNCPRFQKYTPELFCEEDCVYSNLRGEKTLIGIITSADRCVYCKERKIVVVGLRSGSVAICKMITD